MTVTDSFSQATIPCKNACAFIKKVLNVVAKAIVRIIIFSQIKKKYIILISKRVNSKKKWGLDYPEM